MKRLLFAACALLLAGCAASPEIPESTLSQIRASLKPADGQMRYSSVAIWLPNSREFKFKTVEPYVPGVAVLTDVAIIFQGWGGSSGMTTLRQIPFAQIRTASLISFGRSARIVVEKKDDTFESFAASDGLGEISLGEETAQMHKVLSGLMLSASTSTR